MAAMFVYGSKRNEQSLYYRAHSIDASYQVLIHLAKWFQRRRFLEIDQSETQELPVMAMFINGWGRNQQSI